MHCNFGKGYQRRNTIVMRQMKSLVLLSLIALATLGCNRVPITKRKQLNLRPESEMIELANVEYSKFLNEHPPLPDTDPRVQQVRRVGEKIKNNVEAFLKKNNASKRVEGFQWQFEVVDEPVVNAWCMPGGKVVVYTELLKLATDDDLLATVMGHEIAHAIARHGNERMSKGVLVNVGGAVLGAGNEEGNNDVFLQSYGIVTTLGMLKYSRKNESEADKLGLVFMALAGYKPEKAIDFWAKMSKLGGEKPPVLVSTHPSDEQRIADIKAFIPEIPKYLE